MPFARATGRGFAGGHTQQRSGGEWFIFFGFWEVGETFQTIFGGFGVWSCFQNLPVLCVLCSAFCEVSGGYRWCFFPVPYSGIASCRDLTQPRCVGFLGLDPFRDAYGAKGDPKKCDLCIPTFWQFFVIIGKQSVPVPTLCPIVSHSSRIMFLNFNPKGVGCFI